MTTPAHESLKLQNRLARNSSRRRDAHVARIKRAELARAVAVERFTAHSYAGYCWVRDAATSDAILTRAGRVIRFKTIEAAKKRAAMLNAAREVRS